MEYRMKFLEEEGFFGLAVNEGTKMPLLANQNYELDLRVWHAGNQASASLISNKGRYVYSNNPFKVVVSGDELLFEGENIVIGQAGTSLKSAYLELVKSFFVSDQKTPDLTMFVEPQYNTWIEMGYECSQEKVLKYAHEIIEQGYPAGVLMIDDCWSKDYGVWEFDAAKFPNPKPMMDELHALGFKVMLWVCPFVSADSPVFRALKNTDLFVKKKHSHEPALVYWWNGYSCVLNLNKPEACQYFVNQLTRLQEVYGVDGFKLDAADPEFYLGDLELDGFEPSHQTSAYAKIGEQFALNELRVAFNNGLRSVAHRLRDKNHSWDHDGLNTLVPDGILEGLCGYSYFCPDMIGGGMIFDFEREGFQFDEALFVRYAQASALMPMMQFSLLPWRILSKENQEIVYQAVQLHKKYSSIIQELALNTAKTGEPIVRPLIYEYNDAKYLFVKDQFLLGKDLMVAPMVEPGTKRQVLIPQGEWVDDLGVAYTEGKYQIEVKLQRLPIFKKAK